MRCRVSLLLFPLTVLALSACGESQPASPIHEMDPAIVAALNEPITYDPDLSSMNFANRLLSLPVMDGTLPAIPDSQEAIAAARAGAMEIVGGTANMRSAPQPSEIPGPLPEDTSLTAVARAAAVPGFPANCLTDASYTMRWAAMMPPAFPVFPRGAVQEAAGRDNPECSFRSIIFQTPVPQREVMDFYFTRANSAGFTYERTTQDGYDILTGRKGDRAFAAYVHTLPDGLAEVDLVTRN